MMRELNFNEMEMVSGGSESEEDVVIATGTRTRDTSSTVAFVLGGSGGGSLFGSNFGGLNVPSIFGGGFGGGGSGLSADAAREADQLANEANDELPETNPVDSTGLGETSNPDISPSLGINIGNVGGLDVFINPNGPRLGGQVDF